MAIRFSFEGQKEVEKAAYLANKNGMTIEEMLLKAFKILQYIDAETENGSTFLRLNIKESHAFQGVDFMGIGECE